jgi:hypothetical protein
LTVAQIYDIIIVQKEKENLKGGQKMKKEYFTVNGRKYRAPWIITKLAPFAIIAGQMVLVVATAVTMFVIAYGLE